MINNWTPNPNSAAPSQPQQHVPAISTLPDRQPAGANAASAVPTFPGHVHFSERFTSQRKPFVVPSAAPVAPSAPASLASIVNPRANERSVNTQQPAGQQSPAAETVAGTPSPGTQAVENLLQVRASKHLSVSFPSSCLRPALPKTVRATYLLTLENDTGGAAGVP